jgi:mRNA-binding protein PUF3
LKGAERERFVEDMRPQLIALKKYNYGKQITAIEKLISTGPQTTSPSPYNANLNMSSTAIQTPPMDINSGAPTPMLTEQNSPQSSSVPSTNASTADGPTHPGSGKSDATEKATPQIACIERD